MLLKNKYFSGSVFRYLRAGTGTFAALHPVIFIVMGTGP